MKNEPFFTEKLINNNNINNPNSNNNIYKINSFNQKKLNSISNFFENNFFFDYEIDTYIKNKLNSIINSLNKFPDNLVNRYYKCESIPFYYKKCIKSLVSKKKIRLQKGKFDLDLCYITKRVIAMGYPAINCESFYRNSLTDVKSFLYNEHGANFKIYNLCIENERIYDKNIFDGAQVALFPFSDHQACPIKLMMEFCIDSSLYLLNNSNNIIAIHCKAGKGRTGVMICAYLLFSELAKNSTHAFEIYGERRSINFKGLTVNSQKRYVHHFETYLLCNFQRPFFKLIPKIIEGYISSPKGNILEFIFKDNKEYYKFINKFKINKFKIGPFNDKKILNIECVDFMGNVLFSNISNNLKCKCIFKEEIDNIKGKNKYCYIIELIDEFILNSDINVKINNNKDIKFNAWVNLFYITLENFIYLVNTEFKNISFMNNNDNNNKIEMKNFNSIQKEIEFENNFIEMNNLNDLSNNNIIKQKENKKLFIRTYDANFYWKNNISLDGNKLKEFLKEFAKYKGENIQYYDLNNIYEFMNKENSFLFDSKRKKFIIKFDNLGVDKFKKKKQMLNDFCIEITYFLI